MGTRSEQEPAQRAWAAAFGLVAVVVVLTGAALYVFRSLRGLPGEVVEGTRGLARDLGSVAAAFREGRVQTVFLSYGTRVTGTSYFQFATLRQNEVFRRTDDVSLLWGWVDLPDVVVEVSAPVEYTYYLDLDDAWTLRLEGATVQVVAPSIRYNQPAIDASRILYEVRQGSLFRDEEAALSRLKAAVSEMARRRAEENLPLVREIAREQTRRFVAGWLLASFDDGGAYTVEVRFRDAGAERRNRGLGPSSRDGP